MSSSAGGLDVAPDPATQDDIGQHSHDEHDGGSARKRPRNNATTTTSTSMSGSSDDVTRPERNVDVVTSTTTATTTSTTTTTMDLTTTTAFVETTRRDSVDDDQRSFVTASSSPDRSAPTTNLTLPSLVGAGSSTSAHQRGTNAELPPPARVLVEQDDSDRMDTDSLDEDDEPEVVIVRPTPRETAMFQHYPSSPEPETLSMLQPSTVGPSEPRSAPPLRGIAWNAPPSTWLPAPSEPRPASSTSTSTQRPSVRIRRRSPFPPPPTTIPALRYLSSVPTNPPFNPTSASYSPPSVHTPLDANYEFRSASSARRFNEALDPLRRSPPSPPTPPVDTTGRRISIPEQDWEGARARMRRRVGDRRVPLSFDDSSSEEENETQYRRAIREFAEETRNALQASSSAAGRVAPARPASPSPLEYDEHSSSSNPPAVDPQGVAALMGMSNPPSDASSITAATSTNALPSRETLMSELRQALGMEEDSLLEQDTISPPIFAGPDDHHAHIHVNNNGYVWRSHSARDLPPPPAPPPDAWSVHSTFNDALQAFEHMDEISLGLPASQRAMQNAASELMETYDQPPIPAPWGGHTEDERRRRARLEAAYANMHRAVRDARTAFVNAERELGRARRELEGAMNPGRRAGGGREVDEFERERARLVMLRRLAPRPNLSGGAGGAGGSAGRGTGGRFLPMLNRHMRQPVVDTARSTARPAPPAVTVEDVPDVGEGGQQRPAEGWSPLQISSYIPPPSPPRNVSRPRPVSYPNNESQSMRNSSVDAMDEFDIGGYEYYRNMSWNRGPRSERDAEETGEGSAPSRPRLSTTGRHSVAELAPPPLPPTTSRPTRDAMPGAWAGSPSPFTSLHRSSLREPDWEQEISPRTPSYQLPPAPRILPRNLSMSEMQIRTGYTPQQSRNNSLVPSPHGIGASRSLLMGMGDRSPLPSMVEEPEPMGLFGDTSPPAEIQSGYWRGWTQDNMGRPGGQLRTPIAVTRSTSSSTSNPASMEPELLVTSGNDEPWLSRRFTAEPEPTGFGNSLHVPLGSSRPQTVADDIRRQIAASARARQRMRSALSPLSPHGPQPTLPNPEMPRNQPPRFARASWAEPAASARPPSLASWIPRPVSMSEESPRTPSATGPTSLPPGAPLDAEGASASFVRNAVERTGSPSPTRLHRSSDERMASLRIRALRGDRLRQLSGSGNQSSIDSVPSDSSSRRSSQLSAWRESFLSDSSRRSSSFDVLEWFANDPLLDGIMGGFNSAGGSSGSSNGLSPEEIAGLPTAVYKDSEDAKKEERCPICLDDYEETAEVMGVPECKHYFHKQCLSQWLERGRNCPYCRRDIVRRQARRGPGPPFRGPGRPRPGPPPPPAPPSSGASYTWSPRFRGDPAR